jgi:hypothetical protein
MADVTGSLPASGSNDRVRRPAGPCGERHCHNYAGACLEPDAYDYDCSGGDGDGPLYTGQVRVVGDDHYELDRDGDGIACDV